MARRRMIEVTIAHDKVLNSLSEFAQLLYLKILPHTDDYGRFEGDPEVVKVRVDPFSKRKPLDFEKAMAELAGAGLWIWYETDEKRKVLQFNRDAFERINAFLIKKRGNPEYPEYKDSYQLISSDIQDISHRQYKAESIEHKAESRKQKEMVVPKVEEVVAFFSEHGFSGALAKKAYQYYSEADWHDAQGHKVKNWKQKMISVWFKEENRDGKAGEGNRHDPRERETFTDATVERILALNPDASPGQGKGEGHNRGHPSS